MGKIYAVDFNADIIDLVVDSLLKSRDGYCNITEGVSFPQQYDFSSVVIVTPGRRPQFYLRDALARRIKEPFFPPKIFSVEDFIQYLAKKNAIINGSEYSYQPIDITDACFLIYQIIKNLKLTYLDWQKQLEFQHFFLWGRRIFQFLEELDKEMVSERQLLDLQENAQIGLPLPEYINQLLENINQIHKEFHKLLAKRHLTTLGLNYYRLAQAIDKIPLAEFNKIFFVGFFALNACQKKIFKNLLDRDLAVLIWQQDADKWSIFDELQDYFAIAPERIERSVAGKRTSHKYPQVQFFEGFDTHSQMQALRQALGNITDFDNTCIVLPRSESLMPLLYQAIPEEVTDYNISLGYPLRNTPIYALIDMIMQAQENKKQDGSFYTKDYLKVIMHPYIKNIRDGRMTTDMTRILVHKIQEALLGMDKKAGWQKKVFIQLEEIENNPLLLQSAARVINNAGITHIGVADLRHHLELLHKIFMRGFDNCSTVHEFVGIIQAMVDFILEKSVVVSDIFSGEAFNRFLAVLDNLGHSLFKDEVIRNKSAVFELLRICLFFEKIPFIGTPVRGLQILGLLETRNLRFNNLIVLDLNEGVLPAGDKGQSLVPEGIFPILGLPHYHKREQIMRYHFRRLFAAAQNVFLIYASCSRNSESRSRFIEDIIWQQEKQEGHLYDPGRISRVEFRVAPNRDKFCLAKTPHTLNILQGLTISASSLDTYLRCPARFYFRYCLGLKEPEVIIEGVEASEIGNFLHSLLRDFYSVFLNKRVQYDKKSHKYLFELKEKKLKEFFPQHTADRFLLSRIVEHKLALFFSQEAQREQKVKILYLEQNFPIAGSIIKIDTQYGAVSFKGKVDRVDERYIGKKKQIVILDYKTGQYSLPKKNISGIELGSRRQIKKAIGSFQLPLYIYLFSKSQRVSASVKLDASFYSLRDIKEEFLFGNNAWHQQFNIYQAALEKVVSEIISPECDFVRDDEDDYYCRWCPFPALCKR